jgi:hypothetical protein
MIQKYRFMETHLLTRSQGLSIKIPDIKKTLDMCELLAKNQEITTDFEMNETLLVKAKIPKTSTVNLWLGVFVFCLSRQM